MKWTTLIASAAATVVMASPVAMAKGAASVQEQASLAEQNRLRLEQRFQNHANTGAGKQYRYVDRLPHRSGGNDAKQGRYEEQAQNGLFGGKGGGGRR